MPDPADLKPLEEVRSKSWNDHVTDVLEAVVDVARRLDQNVGAAEHLMVVGAENGVETMANAVPSLSAFREAVLDALFEDRAEFRQDDEEFQLTADLVGVLERLDDGEDPQVVLLDVMLSERKRIRGAVDFARSNEPDVLPPDTMILERSLEDSFDGTDTVALEAAAHAAASAAAAAERQPQVESHVGLPRPGAEGTPALELPLIRDLLADTANDPKLVGRDELIDQVARLLLRYQQPAVMLVGQSGSGKTAFVRGLARAAADGTLPALSGFHFYQLKLLDLVAQGHQGQDIHNILDQLFTHISNDDKGVLVIDDMHMLVAKQGAPMMSDVIDTVKFHIKKNALRALVTVDHDAYEKSFRNDPFFTGEITVKLLPVPEPADVEKVLALLRPRLQKHFGVEIADDALKAATAASAESKDYVPPGASIRLLDEACSLARARLAETVTADHVRQSVSESEAATSSDWDRKRLASLERVISERVLGQHAAAQALARRVRLAKLRLDRKPERPDGVFLFIGPSGVGKTEMARGLACALYDDESRLVRLDMSEYMEPHSVARIIGAPPGYVGYGEEGALTGPISRLGHAIVLLDEIEKAHPQVLNIFLQVFDDGRLTDSRGKVVSFSDTVIIMTSNIGRELYAIGGEQRMGFGRGEDAPDKPMKDAVRDHLLRVLPPEFVNRIDELVPFRVLGDDDIIQIADKLLGQEVLRWATWGKTLTYDEGVVEHVAKSGYDPRLGARHIERNVERFVIARISDAAVTSMFEGVSELHLQLKDGEIELLMDGEAAGG